ncbi:MAG TPA: nicotinamide-nucleotide amidase [Candidatus Competibacter sp.]|nr:nicotinamide-nucleotide amidase [Candidatus Competibacteraceae bacterium]HRC73488.1 nicotinamide-nucleotide amidase [Candidatus Competibacter sp.]
MTGSPLHALAAQAGQTLQGRNARLATAESCTGGWIAKVITDVPGSSGWFDRGFVSYSNAAKIDLLGVRESTLARHGAVSAETVAEMAVGALQRSLATVAVAVSGIAGPDGGTPDKPVGTVYLAWASADGSPPRIERRHFSGDRDAVRRQTVAVALQGILDVFSRPS